MPKRHSLPAPAMSLTRAEARQFALRAQGFGQWRTGEPIDVLDQIRIIQLDSVNVVARSHELIPAARLGPTSIASMRRAIYDEKRGFEYWGHAASWLPIDDYRFFRPRMAHLGARWSAVEERHPELYPEILARIRDEGPLGSARFEDPRVTRNGWWDWKPAKLVLEHLFARGDLMCAGRTEGFARLYDLPERVLPGGVDLTDPGVEEANRYFLRRSVAALGVATALDAADYYRLPGTGWRNALRGLVENGDVVEVEVEGWPAPAYVTPSALAQRPEAPDHRPTLLSPFDNLVWDRDRVERLFSFRYRIEIYVPAPKRQFGYYVLPLLARGQLLGRVDVKLDRAPSILRARSVWLHGASPGEADEALQDLATHLGARSIQIDRVIPDGESPPTSTSSE